jgi:signal transduction histidine kinase/ActR/RegA family two-component response regulator
MRILVVEDEELLLEVFGEFLRGLGHDTVLAPNAEVAVRELQCKRPDVILLDVNLPGMSGLDFLQLPSTQAADVPVIAMSGRATEEQATECLRLGAVEFMGKPILLDRLGNVFEKFANPKRLPRAERRGAPRVPMAVPVLVREHDGREWEGTTVDISAVGTRIRVGEPARPPSRAGLSLMMPDGTAVEIDGALVRTDGGTPVYDFRGASEAQRAHLRGVMARYVAATERRSEPHVGILYTIAEAIGKHLDVNAVLDTALDALTHVTGHEISSLHLVSPDGATLRLHGERGLSARMRQLNATLTIGQGLIGRVAATGKTDHQPDMSISPALLPAARDLVAEERLRAFVCVAIQSRGRILGTLALGRHEPEPFTAEEIKLVEASANQIGLALENAKLYEATRTQLEDLRHAETQLVEGDRLSTVGKLAAGVAHEINNPLTTILGQSELLLTRNNLPPEAAERVRIIIEETSRSARLLQSMLHLARPQRAERRLCSLEHQIKIVLELKAHELRHAQIDVATSFAPASPVWADEDQVRQVILNLVQNAQHAMAREAGRRVLTLRVGDVGDRVRVEVLDSGPGIAADVLPRIFDAFFTTKSSTEGTGLGLWVCYGIAEQHGGSLRAENRPGGGAAFILELPPDRRSV